MSEASNARNGPLDHAPSGALNEAPNGLAAPRAAAATGTLGELGRLFARGRFRALLATDLDGTLVGDADALGELNDALAQARGRLALAYVTGRTLASTQALIAEAGLLAPDVIVAGVGAGIHVGPGWAPDADWERRLARGWSRTRVEAAARFFPQLAPQPASHQAPFKCAYYLDAAEAPRTLPALQGALRLQGLNATMIYSSGRDLDVLPHAAGKGKALRYLALRLGLPMGAVLACGDSGNDLEMLTLGCHACAVGNALPELTRLLPPAVYRAHGAYAAGVHEALKRVAWL